MKQITATAARGLVHGEDEIAFLDVREAGEFGEAHPLFAVPLPYSRLELRIGSLVPRKKTPVILIDGGDGIAQRAALRLETLGYDNVSIVDGGIPAWGSAGFPLYKGVNVPSKTLGELAEALWHPKMLQPTELAEWQKRGDNFAFFDTRPADEYKKMRVPGTRCVPNGELAHRLAVVNHDEPVVVTCAGRTRGIIGAIGLQLSGHGGPIFALENGTQGWTLAGLPLERGNAVDSLPEIDVAGTALSRERATRLLESYSIEQIDGKTAAELLSDTGRTTYLFDLRSQAESDRDPVPAATNVLGGQLVQATDQWVGVRRSSIVLACDGGLRSALAAFWLKQLGYHPFVVTVDAALRSIAEIQAAEPVRRRTGLMNARSALSAMKAGALLIDLRGSMAYRREHIEGAIWSIRPRLATLGQLNDRSVVVISDTRDIADIAAIEIAALGARRIDWVEDGHKALAAAGARKKHFHPRPVDRDAIDHLFFVHDRHDGNLDACRRYLEWETGLVAQLDAVERAEFQLMKCEC
ncbi:MULTISPECIES: rhodanese-like domain-containing protein [unclassified Yoonia]|uniref:rhodanese-like domain-containing protein n=1 Tax=unclassified Yoonia TaxID=2629118 RepID=UPI002AFEA1A5|nr:MULTISPECIES: rhodanese-like domain-containing protein [unclassified Yoonia]